MAMCNPQVAAVVRKQGRDALLLSSDKEQVMGSFSTANATATGWAMLPPSATPPPLTEARTPLDRE